MLTLIKRELRNQMNQLVLLVPIMLVCLFISGLDIYVYAGKFGESEEKYLFYYSSFLMVLPIVFGIFSALVCYRECNNKVLTFLHTLATTRSRIFLARCIGGIISSIVILLTIIVPYLIFRLALPFTPVFFDEFIVRYASILFLMMLAGYALGLMAGHWSGNIIKAIIASFLLPAFLIVLVLIKGFDIQSAIILSGITVAAGVIAWHRFKRMGL